MLEVIGGPVIILSLLAVLLLLLLLITFVPTVVRWSPEMFQ